MPKFLPLNLQYFAEGDPEPAGAGEPNNKGGAEPNNPIPYDRFKKVNDEKNDLKEKYEALIKQQQDDDLQKKQEQGQFEELYKTASSELETFKQQFQSADEKIKEYEGVINGLLTSKLELIPEEFHELIPDNLSTQQKLDWINKAEEKKLFTKKNSPLGNATNFNQSQNIDVSKMNSLEKMSLAYKS
jgi:hypothetical protein